MRSQQLLRGMHKVLAHDLPNQMVVLQSLLQLLDQEESAHLSEDGREYVRRLLSATRRAGELARFLKEMDRLNTFACKSEKVGLALLARELQGELQRRHVQCQFEFDWRWHAPEIVGDARVYVQALTELCAAGLSTEGKSCRVSADSSDRGATIELAFQLEESMARPASAELGQQMGFILAREWLALCGARVEVTLPTGEGARFCIVIPKR